MFDEFVRFETEATIEKVLEDMGLGWCLKKACDEQKAGVARVVLLSSLILASRARPTWGVDEAVLASANWTGAGRHQHWAWAPPVLSLRC